MENGENVGAIAHIEKNQIPPTFENSSSTNANNNAINEDKDKQIHNDIIKIGKTDTYKCPHCTDNGDRWYMQGHHCKGNQE